MKDNSNKLLFAIFIGVIAGCVAGVVFGPKILFVKILGDLFLNALKMLVVPLVMVSLIMGVVQIGDLTKFQREGFWTIFFYLMTTALAAVTGIVLVNLIQPGVGMDTSGLAIQATTQKYSFLDVIRGMIPSNIFKSAAEMQILPLIFFSLFFGIVLTQMGEKVKTVVSFFEGLNQVILKMVHIVIYFAPIGVFGLIASRLAAAGGSEFFTGELLRVGKYSLTVMLGLGIHSFITLPILLILFAKRNPFTYIKNVAQALLTAISTASSSATIPVTLECVEQNAKIDKKVAGFVIPLGATINMDGTALYEAIAAIFIAQAYGIDLSLGQQVIIFLTASLAAIGAAGIPQAGLVTMVMVLNAVGLPTEGIGMILAVDWFLDRFRTVANVFGDTVVAAIVAKQVSFKTSFWRALKS